MSDYDFRPGSLNLKRTAGDGQVKKYDLVHFRYHLSNSK